MYVVNLSHEESYYYEWLVTVCWLSGNTMPARQ